MRLEDYSTPTGGSGLSSHIPYLGIRAGMFDPQPARQQTVPSTSHDSAATDPGQGPQKTQNLTIGNQPATRRLRPATHHPGLPEISTTPATSTGVGPRGRGRGRSRSTNSTLGRGGTPHAVVAPGSGGTEGTMSRRSTISSGSGNATKLQRGDGRATTGTAGPAWDAEDNEEHEEEVGMAGEHEAGFLSPLIGGDRDRSSRKSSESSRSKAKQRQEVVLRSTDDW